MKRFNVALTCFALIAVCCVDAMAGTWLANNRAGSVSGSFDSFSPTDGDISNALTVTDFLYNSGSSSRQGAFAGITEVGVMVWSTTAVFDALGLTVGDFYTFTSPTFGSFSGSITAESSTNPSSLVGTGNRTLDFTGIFTPGSNAHYEGDTTSLFGTTLQVAFSRNDGGSINAAWSFDTTAAANVPEPTSMAIFGLGTLGIAVRRIRRK